MSAARKPRTLPKTASAGSQPAGEVLSEKASNLSELMQRVLDYSEKKDDLDTLLKVLESYGISCTRLVILLRAQQDLSESVDQRQVLEALIERINAADRALIEAREKRLPGQAYQPRLPDLDRPAAPPAPMPGNFTDES